MFSSIRHWYCHNCVLITIASLSYCVKVSNHTTWFRDLKQSHFDVFVEAHSLCIFYHGLFMCGSVYVLPKQVQINPSFPAQVMIVGGVSSRFAKRRCRFEPAGWPSG